MTSAANPPTASPAASTSGTASGGGTIAASFILPSLNRTVAYATVLCKDIPAGRFAHMPHPKMNHPAFNLGHLSLYPNRVLTTLGRGDLVRELDGWQEIFGAGVECVDDAPRYPDKDAIVSAFTERHGALARALEDVSDEVLFRENPTEGRFREMFPTVGAAVTFMCGSHTMMHLGQISAWRRAIGLGPAT